MKLFLIILLIVVYLMNGVSILALTSDVFETVSEAVICVLIWPVILLLAGCFTVTDFIVDKFTR